MGNISTEHPGNCQSSTYLIGLGSPTAKSINKSDSKVNISKQVTRNYIDHNIKSKR